MSKIPGFADTFGDTDLINWLVNWLIKQRRCIKCIGNS